MTYSVGDDVYRLIDHYDSFGTMTTEEIARQVVVAEYVVANYLAAKRGPTKPHPKADLEGGKKRSDAAALQDARKKEREGQTKKITARERRAIEANDRKVALARREARMARIREAWARSANDPERFVAHNGKFGSFSSDAPRSAKVRMHAGVLNHRALEGYQPDQLYSWTPNRWMSYALDVFPESENWEVAAIAKYARRLTEARLKLLGVGPTIEAAE